MREPEPATVKANCGPILIVENDAPCRELVRMVLDGAGYSTVEVASGEGALASAAEQRPALVLLDVHLPGVSGYEVCRELRERFGEELPIIFLSGTRKEAHDRVAGMLIGADDYMAKPFAPDELAARVRRLLRRAGDGQPHNHDRARLTARLTKREHQVLELLARGLKQEAIAAELFISPKTVATHIQRILTKLDVRSRAEAVSSAYRLGLVAPDSRAAMLAAH